MEILIGKVISGENIGSKHGYPTANLSRRLLAKHALSEGVHLARAFADRKVYTALVVVGVPGVRLQKKGKLEVHLVGYHGNLYGKVLRVFVYRKLRKLIFLPDQRQLLQQIRRDISAAKKYFSS